MIAKTVIILLLALLLGSSCAQTLRGTGDEGRELESVPAKSRCVTVFEYRDKTCQGDLLREERFDTWAQPGAPCHHHANMPDWISVKNMYCTDQFFKRELFVGSETCDSWEHYEQVLRLGDCFFGFEFVSCTEGLCDAKE